MILHTQSVPHVGTLTVYATPDNSLKVCAEITDKRNEPFWVGSFFAENWQDAIELASGIRIVHMGER